MGERHETSLQVVKLGENGIDINNEDESRTCEKTAKECTSEQGENRAILQHIPLGRENAVTGGYLQAVLGTSARGVQQMIERARRAGHVIINDQDGRGYYVSEDPDDWERQYWQDTSRALAILTRRKHLRRLPKEAGRDVCTRGKRRDEGK